MAGTVSIQHGKTRTVQKISLAWTSDASGDVSGTPLPGVSGELLRVTFKPSGTAVPTLNYDVTLLDEEGVDVLAGAGANLSDTATLSRCPLIGDGTNTTRPVAVDGTLNLVVAAAGNAKQGTVVLYVR